MRIPWQLLLSLTLVAHVTLAADTPQRSAKTPAHTPEWTNSNDADPGTTAQSRAQVQASTSRPTGSQMDELQKIVVLCATEPESQEFKRAWGNYVERYHQPDAKLDRAIENVLARASAYRQSRHSSTGKLTWTAAERQQARQVMQDTAMAVIRKMGG